MLRKKDGKSIPFDQAVSHMDRLINDSESLSEKAGTSREDYDLARFAVFAWIDENIMRSTWKAVITGRDISSSAVFSDRRCR